MEGIVPPKRKVKLQFKKKGTSILTEVSGIYEVERDPVLLYAPLGL
jgi:hypothetical protein